MPDVGMLCWGRPATSSVHRFVVTTNVSRWNGLEPLGTWARDARRYSLPNNYVERLTYLSEQLAERGHLNNNEPDAWSLKQVWTDAENAGPPVIPDTTLQWTWKQLCDPNLNPIIGPRIFTRPLVLTALAFDCHTGIRPDKFTVHKGLPRRERCVRCRVLFRFNMSDDEPKSYRGGPYPNPLSCAEVAAFDKCRRHEL